MVLSEAHSNKQEADKPPVDSSIQMPSLAYWILSNSSWVAPFSFARFLIARMRAAAAPSVTDVRVASKGFPLASQPDGVFAPVAGGC